MPTVIRKRKVGFSYPAKDRAGQSLGYAPHLGPDAGGGPWRKLGHVLSRDAGEDADRLTVRGKGG
jgi:hypothetical protein